MTGKASLLRLASCPAYDKRKTRKLRRLLARYRPRTGLVVGVKTLALQVLQPDRALVLRTAQDAHRLRKKGDLSGALAVYDGLSGKLRQHPALREERGEVLRLLRKRIIKEGRQFRDAGHLANALALYDGLSAELRDHPDIAHERASVYDLLRKRTKEEIRGLRRAGDLLGALAVFDVLPPEVRELADIRQARNDLLELVVTSAQKEAHRLRRAGDLTGAFAVLEALPQAVGELADIRQARNDLLELVVTSAQKKTNRLRRLGDFGAALAVYEGLPPDVRESAGILQERASLLLQSGRVNQAHDVFRAALLIDPTQRESWRGLGIALRGLGRSDEIEPLIGDFLAALSPTFETLVQAAQIARSAKLPRLTDSLLERALSIRATASPAATVQAGHVLLRQGEQGRVIDLLKGEAVRSDPYWGGRALELSDRAFAQLQLAGRSRAAGPIGETERADVIAALSILAQSGPAPAVIPRRRGIAVIVSSLGAGGTQQQSVELVRQLRGAFSETVGPIFLFLVSRSSSEAEFFAGTLDGLDVTVEFMSDAAVDVGKIVSEELAAKLSVLPYDTFLQTVWYIDRLRAHAPEVVLAMSDLIGLPTMLAASIVGLPRVVVSARSGPPPARWRADRLLKPAYQMALSRHQAALVANSAATARAFAEWLEEPATKVRVIYNGVDVDGLLSQRDPAATAAHRRALGIPGHARIVGSVFQARPVKRPQLWIEAAAVIVARAPDVVFAVVGDKLQRDDVDAAIAKYQLQDRFHRPGVRMDVASWLDLMDVFLLTSEAEGTPVALLEAQALGRPVVATDAGGNAECFLPDVTGILLSANPTPEQVADAVLRVLNDPGFTARAREQGPRFIRQRFDPKRMASEYLDLCLGDGRELPSVSVDAVATAPPALVQWNRNARR